MDIRQESLKKHYERGGTHTREEWLQKDCVVDGLDIFLRVVRSFMNKKEKETIMKVTAAGCSLYTELEEISYEFYGNRHWHHLR